MCGATAYLQFLPLVVSVVFVPPLVARCWALVVFFWLARLVVLVLRLVVLLVWFLAGRVDSFRKVRIGRRLWVAAQVVCPRQAGLYKGGNADGFPRGV